MAIDKIKHSFSDACDILFQSAALGLWEYDIAADTFYCNPQFELITGFTIDEVNANKDLRCCQISREDYPALKAMFDDIISGRTRRYEIIYKAFHKNGGGVWLKEHCVVSLRDEQGRPLRIACMLQDVTEFKLVQEKLLAENLYREHVGRLVGLGGWEWDIDSDIMSFNDDYRQMLGYAPAELDAPITEVCERHMHPDDIERVINSMYAYLKNPQGMFVEEMRLRHRNGHYLWLYDVGSVAEWDKDGKPLRIVGGVLNIDSRVRAEQQLLANVAEMEQYNDRLKLEVNKAVRHLQKLRETSSAMFDSNPHINLLFNSRAKLVDCNPIAVDAFGCASKEELLANFDKMMMEWTPKFQPDGSLSLSFKNNFNITMERGFNSYETELVIDGWQTAFDVICKRVPYEDSYAMVAYLIDLSRIRITQSELQRQSGLLHIINSIAAHLVAAAPDDFERVMQEAMSMIGQAVEADRIRIWRNFTDDEGFKCREIYGWSQLSEKLGFYRLESNYRDMPYWLQVMRQHKPINALVADLPRPEREMLQAQGVISILVVPIYIQDEFWGFIGYDDCSQGRLFGEAEENVLQSAGNIMVSSILRNHATINLIEAREAAIHSANAKSEFLSRMSHEIRTPMNAIIGMTTLARRTDEMDKISEYLDKVDASSRQLLGIINDVLDMSKIDANKFEISYHEFDFEKMLQNVFNVMQVKLEEKGQDFQYDFERLFTRNLIGDELRLTQVLLNLLSNAVKFTPDGGSIKLKVRERPTAENASVLRVEVIDSGIGVSSEQQKKLFQSFEQADGSITRQFGGTGLGLAISKKIIELMGGNIWVESEQGFGASFIFEIKVQWGEPCRASGEKLQLRQDLRVLVVDDAQDTLDYISGVLRGFAMQVETAADPRLAVEMVEQSTGAGKPFHIVFVDWNMPHMNGGQTARAIRQIMHDNVLIIMISVSEWNEIEQQASQYQVNHFMQKPILPSSLYDTLAQFSGRTMEKAKQAPKKEKKDWSGKTVLLVEDITINREIVIRLLDNTKLSFDVAKDGQEAVALFSLNPDKYDLILMDVQMPVLDGLSATRLIRQMDMPAAQNVPIVAMTANAFKEDVQECLEAGMNGHVAKPIELAVLVDTLSNYLD